VSEHDVRAAGKAMSRRREPSRRIRTGSSRESIAPMYDTPIYVWENGKVVAKKP